MPEPVIPKPTYPNVPDLPGVPAVPRSDSVPTGTVPPAATDATQGSLWQASQSAPKWGVFNSSGIRVVAPDSVVDFDFRQEYRVSNYPVQQGQFASFDKVIVPQETSVRMTKGGTLADRTAFLASCDTVTASLALYTILTPEKSYQNVNVTRYELSRRSVKGAFFVEVDLFFVQINQVAAQYAQTGADTSNALVPSAQPPTNDGLVSATPTTGAAATGAAAAPGPVP